MPRPYGLVDYFFCHGIADTAVCAVWTWLAQLIKVGLHQSREAELHGDDDCKSVFVQAWDPQHRRLLWTKQVGGEHSHARARHSQLQAGQKPAAFRSPSLSSSHLVRPSSAGETTVPGQSSVSGAEPLMNFPRRQCAVGRQVALSVSADQTHSMLYAADIATAQSGYGYSRTTPPSGTPNLKQAQLHDVADRVQPQIVALNSETVRFNAPYSCSSIRLGSSTRMQYTTINAGFGFH